MKNPLHKRYKRELRQDLGKYIAIFLFMVLSIGFISGFLVAGTSMKTAYDQSFKKYNIEDGHFILKEKADKDLIKTLQDDEHVKLYSQPYIEEKATDDNTYRIYANRSKVNKISVLSGRMAKADDEITIDRLFAENNDIKVGDSIQLNGTSWKVCGLVAFSDYSALFEDNSDLMFDAQTFTVAAVTQGGFDAMAENLKKLDDGSTQTRSLHYNYAWKWEKQGMSEQTRRDKSDDLLSKLVKEAFFSDNEVKDFLQEADNQAIHFSGNDLGGDKQMVIWFMYIITAILAFVFAVTTLNWNAAGVRLYQSRADPPLYDFAGDHHADRLRDRQHPGIFFLQKHRGDALLWKLLFADLQDTVESGSFSAVYLGAGNHHDPDQFPGTL